ncbi:Vacuolar cation/proton exchanger 2 [Pseudocercospora fuligena]|uniref:Vacuolar calcium ion transporter n=1 Tax=Pseudocercospora fuligena TaxID=685502 RepID=A0A8H6R7F3_9PEZI|nr:Vacuolar cation/proton exchanger 2 [Pseudocercospora fuligena]
MSDRQPRVNPHPTPHQNGNHRNATWSKAKVFRRKDAHPQTVNDPGAGTGNGHDGAGDQEKGHAHSSSGQGNLPMYNGDGHRVNHNGHKVTPGIQPDGESGRSWFNPIHFFRIIWTSSCTASKWTNILWPFTLAALVLYFHYPEHELWIFITAYIGMVPAANLVGFAGQELARKIPKVAGVLLEVSFGSIVEIILFMVLLIQGGEQNVPVIRAAILGSILANLLMCLGLCFFVGGIFHPQQTFHEAISEVGSNLMLVAGMGLVIPTIYYSSLSQRSDYQEVILPESLKISRAAAIILLTAFIVYVWFQARSHHGLYEDILEADEMRDHDRHKDLVKPKLTLTESILALLIALMFVSFMAVFLVKEIEFMVNERNVSDAFVGLILIPIVEKASEHITAVDEAYDNQMNFALSHVLGASIQTALLNTPLVVLVGWGQGINMSLEFELFDAVILILAIIVVGNFLRDEKSDYLEGALCVFVYMLIAIAAFYYPNPNHGEGPASGEQAAHRLMKF